MSERCRFCDTFDGHSYDCVTLWRKRRENRDNTYTEERCCGGCMFGSNSIYKSRSSDKAHTIRCDLPVTDHDDAVCENGGVKIVSVFGLCSEWRSRKDEKDMDRPWSRYPEEWIRFNDDIPLDDNKGVTED